VLQPRLILLDEPFGALDQQTRLLMGDELLRLWRDTGATVLLITHALDEAAMLAGPHRGDVGAPGRILDIVVDRVAARPRQHHRCRGGVRRDHRPAVAAPARRIAQANGHHGGQYRGQARACAKSGVMTRAPLSPGAGRRRHRAH